MTHESGEVQIMLVVETLHLCRLRTVLQAQVRGKALRDDEDKGILL